MDSKSFRSFDGHLDKREKLLVKIGWSQLNACCLILLWPMGGIRKGPICAKRYTFMLTNPAYEVSFGFTNIYGLALSTWIFINNIWWHHKRDLILKGEKWTDFLFNSLCLQNFFQLQIISSRSFLPPKIFFRQSLPSIFTGCNFSFQCNKLKKKFLFKQERDGYSSFNRTSFVTFVTVKVTIWQMHVK